MADSSTPANLKEFTVEELKEYDGKKSKTKPILLALNKNVFDVSIAKHLYGTTDDGETGAYAKFAGRDISRALASYSLEDNILPEVFDNLNNLTKQEKDQIENWEKVYIGKYKLVGKLVKEKSK